mmetsp:Transcript_42331/g.111991  ORF Transcript_42331/g.111991 Transcript_42331/m.111991 type:complete len:276 (+) Transcript_42331:1347-2174(+)
MISCCVSWGSVSRMRSPSLLKRTTADSKIGLDSEKSASAGKKVDQTFQNSCGDFTRVSTMSCARFAKVSKTRTAISSISGRAVSFACGDARAALAPPSLQCSMKETTMSRRVSITFISSSDSIRMLRTSGLMMSATGLTNTPGCVNAASAPADVFGWQTALRSAAFAGVMCLFVSLLSCLPLSCVKCPAMAFTPTSLTYTSSSSSSSLDVSRSFRGLMAFRLCCWMSSGASTAFWYRRSSWYIPSVSMARIVLSTLSWTRWIDGSFRRFEAVSRM